MKKYMLAFSLAALIMLSACTTQTSLGNQKVTESESVADVESVEETVSEEAEDNKAGTLNKEADQNLDDSSSESEESSSDASSEASSSETETKIEYYDFKLAEGLSEKYADLDNRSFVYNGKVYKLGETTLKDLIDGGLPFDEKKKKNAENNVNGNHETSRYTINLNDLTFIQLVFINKTDDSMPEKDCLLSTVRWNVLYVPHDDYQDSLIEQIVSSINDCAKDLSFSFPYYLTKDELLEKCPDPTSTDEYGKVSYMVASEVYMGSSGYSFQFDKDTNQLKDVTISWLP